MFFKKEKKVIELILKHLDLVVDSLKSGIQAVECYLNNDIGNAKRLAREVSATTFVINCIPELIYLCCAKIFISSSKALTK